MRFSPIMNAVRNTINPLLFPMFSVFLFFFLSPLISRDAGKASGSFHSKRFSNGSLSVEGRVYAEVVGHVVYIHQQGR